jgi:DNA gyrase subunit A
VALIEDPDLDVDGLMEYIKAPDFPTGGIVYGVSGVRQAYHFGKGHLRVRAKAFVEALKNGRENIVITEIPYMVVKGNLLEKMADLVREKRVDGIRNIRDESDRDGTRIVVELRRDSNSEVILNQLYRHTQLETTFAANMIALVDGQPKLLNLKELLQHTIDHRHEVVLRRTRFELQVAEDRAHILEGLRIALDQIDLVVSIIRASEDPDAARQALMERLELSERQAQAILSMTLQRLTNLERQKIEDEYAELIREIERLRSILESRAKRMEIVKEELRDIQKRYGDERRTEIVLSDSEFDIEDLIAEEEMVVTISHSGYIKRMPVSAYRAQRRGGRGITGMKTKEEDFVEHMFVASTHSYILFLTDRGRCHWLKVYQIPQGSRASRGRPVVNVIDIDPSSKVAAIVPVREFGDDHYLIQVTEKGLVKKTALSAYSRPRRGGIIAIQVADDDCLTEAKITDGSCDVVLATRHGMAIRFAETDVREMGRDTRGVKGISLAGGDVVVGMVVTSGEGTILSVCANGYGKRTEVSDYPTIRRGGKGVINIKTTDRNGEVVAARGAQEDDELMIISHNGVLIRAAIRDVSIIGRNTQGVRLINLAEGDRVIDVARVIGQNGENGENGDEEEGHPPEAGSNGNGQLA